MTAWSEPHAVADGVVCAVRRLDEVLAAGLPDPADRRTAASMPAWRASEYVAARTLLRVLLAGTPERCADAVIASRPSGQPYLPAFDHLGVSLSHSAGWVAAAVGVGQRVGIDVQVPEPVDRGVLWRCCPPDAAKLEALPEPARSFEFAWIWTAQEACVKATGAGFGGRPWRIPVTPRRRTGEWMGLTWVSLRGHTAVPAACAHGRLVEGDGSA